MFLQHHFHNTMYDDEVSFEEEKKLSFLMHLTKGEQIYLHRIT